MEAPADSTWRGYSVAERDRRWNAVRERGARAGFDCLFVPLGNGLDGEYLTQMTTAVVVLPTDGRPPIVINDRGRPTDWVQDVRAVNREWARHSADALIEAGMERARIGVVGLRGGRVSHVRAGDGVVIHTPYAEEVRRRLPNATFEDATDVVGMVRYVKSDEEIACLRRAAAIAEAGINEMIEIARPGVDEAVVYARVTARMMELGSAHYHWALVTHPWDDVEQRVRSTAPPIGRRLQSGTYITNEVSAIWGGMVAQEDQPILLGPTPDAWKPVIELQREVFEAGLERMRLGMSFADFIDFVNGFGEKRGMKTLTLLHGRGMGDDGPLLTPRSRGDAVRDITFEAGTAFVWKPYGMSADGRLEFVWGGDVVVTDSGAKRLFKRSHGLVEIL